MGSALGECAQCAIHCLAVHVYMHERGQRDDIVILAHIREQHRLSLQSYGCPRMTEELQELGVSVGHQRVGRLMRDNCIKIIRTNEGWLYLAVIMDLYSRRLIGWAVSYCMKRDLAIRALDMAVALRQPSKGCIHYTDRGSQCCSHDY